MALGNHPTEQNHRNSLARAPWRGRAPPAAAGKGRAAVYTLRPLQDGSFNWSGSETIKAIVLIQVCFRLPGGTESVVKISSSDVLKTLAEDLQGVSLDAVDLLNARFRFILAVAGLKHSLTFTIAPPAATYLSDNRYSPMIFAYLKEQGVVLP